MTFLLGFGIGFSAGVVITAIWIAIIYLRSQ